MSTLEILNNLRQKIKQAGLEGLIIPHSDEFQNETLPPESKRLFYVTGFDGSAGLCIVLLENAALFVDGRYTLAAKSAINTNLFSLLPWSQESIQDFLKVNLKKGAVLGIDPWCVSENEFEGLKNLGEKENINLKMLLPSLLDDVWKERPLPSLKKSFLWDDNNAGESTVLKRLRISKLLKEEKVEGLYIASPASLNWLLNIRGYDVPYTPLALATGILYQQGNLDVFIECEKVPSFFQDHFGPEVRFLERNQLESILSKWVQKIWYDPAHTPVALREILQKGGWVHKPDPCILEKACKTPQEIRGMQACHRRDGQAMVQFLYWLETQDLKLISEIEAASQLKLFRETLPLYHSLSFETISAVGEHAAIVHYRPSLEHDKLLSEGDLYLVDSGGQYLDGTTDITRTILLKGKNASTHIKEIFTYVLKGHIALASVKFPKGTTGLQLDILARQFLWQKGLDYAHGTGHGVGSFLSVHEGPQNISKRQSSAVPLIPGMVVSNEPGYYEENAFGIRIESLLLVTKTQDPNFYGFETLTLVPIDRNLILKDLLTSSEITWLNQYHACVFEELFKTLNAESCAWLKDATRPLD